VTTPPWYLSLICIIAFALRHIATFPLVFSLPAFLFFCFHIDDGKFHRSGCCVNRCVNRFVDIAPYCCCYCYYLYCLWISQVYIELPMFRSFSDLFSSLVEVYMGVLCRINVSNRVATKHFHCGKTYRYRYVIFK